MNTPSHAILNLFLLNRQLPTGNLAILTGAILPDIPIFIFYIWAKWVRHLPERQIWSETYFLPFWQNFVDLFHSIPLALTGYAIASAGGWVKIQILCLSLVLHSLLDLPVHNDDAHRHFFPFSNYRLISPFSYWDTQHYGGIVALVELLLVLLATSQVFPWIHSGFGKILMISVNIFYLIMYVSFYLKSLISSS